MTTVALVILVLVLGPVLVSMVIEALRPAPPIPEELAWSREIATRYAAVKGHRLNLDALRGVGVEERTLPDHSQGRTGG